MPRRPEAGESTGSTGSEGELPFESALEQLEALLSRLEGGALSLEEALATFEQGVSLSRRCAEELERVERRVDVLVRSGDVERRRPFEPGEED
jgi:exodeoxyribonuclease VII small subunit